MKHICLTTLMLLSGIPAAHAQLQLRGGVDVGTSIAMGDLGRSARPGFMGALSLRVGKPGSRSSFALEAHIQQVPIDSHFIAGEHRPGFPNTADQHIQASTWRAYGLILRTDYAVTGGLYAIGGVGLLRRRREFVQAPREVAPTEGTDPVAQVGLGYRVGRFIVIETRFMNVFTVNQSERMLPFTVGVRF